MKQNIIAALALATLIGASVLSGGEVLPTETGAASRPPHSCCPGSSPRVNHISSIVIGRSSKPCHGQRPCCTLQAPERPATPATANRLPVPDSEAMGIFTADPLQRRDGVKTALRLIRDVGISPLERSTILRI
jgi:hypothetical protein